MLKTTSNQIAGRIVNSFTYEYASTVFQRCTKLPEWCHRLLFWTQGMQQKEEQLTCYDFNDLFNDNVPINFESIR